MASPVDEELYESLNELEKLLLCKLTSEAEIKSIISTRRELLYGLYSQQSKKEDYLRLLEFECNLLGLLTIRMAPQRNTAAMVFEQKEVKSGVPGMEPVLKMTTRIIKYFNRATIRYPRDDRIWLQYIHWAAKTGLRTTLTRALLRTLQLRSTVPEYWILAADFEWRNKKNILAARRLLQRGIRMNAKCQKLYIEYFRLELLYIYLLSTRAEYVKKTKELSAGKGLDEQLPQEIESNDTSKIPILEDSNSAISQGRIATIVVRHAMKQFPDNLDIIRGFLGVIALFNKEQDMRFPIVEDTIFEYLRENTTEPSQAWGLLTEYTLSLGEKETDRERAPKKDRESIAGLTEVLNMWEQKLAEDPTAVNIAESYLEFILSSYTKFKSRTQVKKCALLRRRFVEFLDVSMTSDNMTPKMWLLGIDTLIRWGKPYVAFAIAKSSIKSKGTNADVVCAYVKLYSFMLTDLDIAKCGLKEDTKWLDYRRTCEALLSDTRTDDLKQRTTLWAAYLSSLWQHDKKKSYNAYKKCLEDNQIARQVFGEYFGFVTKNSTPGDINLIREMYNLTIDCTQLPYYQWNKILGFEKKQKTAKSTDHITRLYTRVAVLHGAKNCDLWLDAIRWQYLLGNTDRASSLYWEATRQLKPEHVQDFTQRHSLKQAQWQNEMSK